jgi:hypothetical protein
MRRISAPPAFLIDSLGNQSVGAESLFEGLPDTKVPMALKAMVMSIVQAKSTLETTQSLAKALKGAQRLGFEKWTEEAAFTLLPYVHSTSTVSAPITPSELMALAVVVGLEHPDEDHDGRLNTWGKRFRSLRRRVTPSARESLGPVVNWLGQVIGARADVLGRHTVGLLTKGRKFI